MSKIKTYIVKSSIFGGDLITRTSKQTNNQDGFAYDETVNATVDQYRDYFAAGLTPIEGGTLKITPIEIDDLDTDIATTVNQITPPYQVVQYETVFFTVAGQVFLLNKVDRTIGFGETPLVNADFIEFPISVGPAGTNGSTIRSGTTVPDNSLGENGDFYIRTTNGFLYKKDAGAYVYQLTLIGANGTNGLDGAQIYYSAGVPSSGFGNNGDTYVNTSNGDLYKKSAGSWGSPVFNIKGAPGTNGTNGTDGTTYIANSNYIKFGGDGTLATPYNATPINKQDVTKTNSFTLTNNDDQTTIWVNNNTTDVVITVPSGLNSAFTCIIIQRGTGTIQFLESGTTILMIDGYDKVISGQNGVVVLEQRLSSNEYLLSGNLALM